MKHLLAILVLAAACVPQDSTPSTQPAWGRSTGAPVAATTTSPGATGAGASCSETLACYNQCGVTDSCIQSCDAHGSADGDAAARAVLTCIAQSGCQDQSCVAQSCTAQLSACTNMTVAVAPAAPASGSGGSCEQEMTPEYLYSALVIPALRCSLSQADLAGSWSEGSGSVKAHIDSSGNYVGASTVSTASDWVVGADGSFTEHWRGATTSVGGGVSGYSQTNTGTFTVENGNLVKIYREATDGNRASTQYFIVAGWFVGADDVTMSLDGPYYENPPAQQDYARAAQWPNNGTKYHRPR